VSIRSQPGLTRIARRLAWFDKRSDCPDGTSILVLPRALSSCFATGQDEIGDLHLGAFLEWCAPSDGLIWERVAAAEQQPASGSTSPEFDRIWLLPRVDAYVAASAGGDVRAATREKKAIHQLIGAENSRRYALATAALQLLRGLQEADVAREISAERITGSVSGRSVVLMRRRSSRVTCLPARLSAATLEKSAKQQ